MVMLPKDILRYVEYSGPEDVRRHVREYLHGKPIVGPPGHIHCILVDRNGRTDMSMSMPMGDWIAGGSFNFLPGFVGTFTGCQITDGYGKILRHITFKQEVHSRAGDTLTISNQHIDL